MKLTCLACGQANRVPDDALDRGPKCAVCGAGLLPDHPVEVDAATLDKAARGDGLPLIVDFWAPWCGPCRSMAPEFAKAAQGLAGKARFVKLNTEAEPRSGARHNIRAIPTMVKFRRPRGGAAIRRDAGAGDCGLGGRLTKKPAPPSRERSRRGPSKDVWRPENEDDRNAGYPGMNTPHPSFL